MTHINTTLLILMLLFPFYALADSSSDETLSNTKLLAEAGYAGPQWVLGTRYETGDGVTEDLTEAAKWYRKAAEQGHKDAQVHLGSLYYFGKGVARDVSESTKWFRKAAEQGDTIAQYFVGRLYYIDGDYAGAAEWYRKAAEGGESAAQLALGYAYIEGQGVQMNKIEAYNWWLKAAKQGQKHAQNNLDILCQKSPWACK